MSNPVSKARWLALAPLALACGMANAMGLGQIQVKSKPGEPLRAHIPILISDPDEMVGLRAGLADPATFARIGLQPPQGTVADLRFQIVQGNNGLPVVEVSSSAPMYDPVITFLLELNWSQGRMVREFSALVDMPTTLSASAPIIQAPQAAPSNLITRDEPTGAGEQQSGLDQFIEQQGLAGEPYSEYTMVRDVPDPQPQAYVRDVPEDFSLPVDPTLEVLPEPTDETQAHELALEESTTPVIEHSVPLPEPVAEPPVVTPPPVAPAHVASALRGGDTLAQVQKGQVLSNIAKQLVGNGRTLNQAMVALVQANPKAFINGNVNLVRAGAVLRVPEEQHWNSAEVARANKIVAEHVAKWHELNAPKVEQAQEESTKQASTGQDPLPAPIPEENTNARLEILASPGERTEAGAASGKDKDGQGSRIGDEQLEQEQELVKQQELEELRSRLEELEGITKAQEKLIELKNDELRKAQENLRKAQAKQANPSIDAKTVGIGAGIVALLGLILAGLRRRIQKKKEKTVEFLHEENQDVIDQADPQGNVLGDEQVQKTYGERDVSEDLTGVEPDPDEPQDR